MPIRVSDVLRNQSNSYPLVRAEDNQVAGLGYFTTIQDRSNLPTPKRTSSFIAVMALSSGSFVCQFIGTDPLDDGEWTDVRNWAKLGNEKNVFELMIEDSVRRGSNLGSTGTFDNSILGDFDQDGDVTVDDFLTFVTGYVNTSSTSARTGNTSQQRLNGRIGSSVAGAHLATWEFDNYDGANDFMLATTKAINEEIDTKITASIGNFDFDTSQTFTSGKDNFVLTYDHASGLMKLEDIDTSGGLERVAGDSTKANVSFTSDTGLSVSASDKTGISLSESSPGNISFSVNADTDNNNPTSITALTIAGQSAAAKATITFDSAATISGIVLNDLDNADVGSPSTGHFLKYDGSNWVGSALPVDSVVSDVSPQLGGNLDVNGNSITSASNGDITIDPDGTGSIILKSDDIQFQAAAAAFTSGTIRLYESSLLTPQHYISIASPASVTADTTLTLPDGAGSSGQVLSTNGSGTLSWATVVEQNNPDLFGILELKTVGGTQGEFIIYDNDNSHYISIQAPTVVAANVDFILPAADGSANQVLKTDGSGNLSFDTVGDVIDNRKFTKTSNTDGDSNGDVVYIGGTTSMTTGALYHYKSDGTWELADADAASTCDGLLGIALGAASDTNGVLLRGMVTIDHDPGAVGDVLFVSTTAGDITATAPSGNGDIVRVVGYCLDATNGQIWFNPDGAFVEVSA